MSLFDFDFGWISPVIDIIKDGLHNDKTDVAQSKGLMAPPSPIPTKSNMDKYDVGKFNPQLGYNKSSSGSAPNAIPAIQSVDPVSREVQFWTQLFAKSQAQAKM